MASVLIAIVIADSRFPIADSRLPIADFCRMHQYYVAMVLPEELNRKVLPHKEWMRERYGCLVGLKSPAHITLLPPFWMHPDLEQALLAGLRSFAATQEAFTIRTSGFSAFKPHTLFIDVVADAPLQKLKSACDEWFLERPTYGIRIDRRPFHPHVTIATRDLPKGAFAEAWAHFQKKAFNECWKAEALSLMKHNGKGWEVAHTAAIGNRESGIGLSPK